MKVLVIIPAYNEERCILDVVKELKSVAPWADYVVINDCSSDGTKDLCEREGANIVNLPVNLGIGGSIQTGYLYALEWGYDIAVQMDGDGQHDPSCLKDIVLPIEKGEADIVIGSRFIHKEGFQSSGARRAGIRFLSSLIFLLTGMKIKDVTSGFRAVNKKFIRIYAQDYAQDYPEPEAIVRAASEGAKIKEMPVSMRPRSGGTSSITLFKSFYYMVKVSIAIILCRIYDNKNFEDQGRGTAPE